MACQDFGRFKSMVGLVSFAPFTTADMAIENINAVVQGQVTPFLFRMPLVKCLFF